MTRAEKRLVLSWGNRVYGFGGVPAESTSRSRFSPDRHNSRRHGEDDHAAGGPHRRAVRRSRNRQKNTYPKDV
jgi:hypothetical protein